MREIKAEGTELHFSILYAQMSAFYVSGKLRSALATAEDFISLAKSQSRSEPLLVGHRILGTALLIAGDFRNSLSHTKAALELYRPEEHHESALRYGQDIGVSSLCYLSWALWHAGYPDQAKAADERALALAWETGHQHTLAYAHFHSAFAGIHIKPVKTIEENAIISSRIAEQHGFPLWAAYCKILLGWVSAQIGDAASGIEQIHQGLLAARAIGSGFGEPLFQCMLAESLAIAGRIQEAIVAVDEGLAIAAESGQVFSDPALYCVRGNLLLNVPSPDSAAIQACFQQALAVSRQQGSRGVELRAALYLARLWAEERRQEEARELLAQVYGGFSEGFNSVDLRKAKALLDAR